MKQFDKKELARQLRCPSGDLGLTLMTQMFELNSNMIYKTIDRLAIRNNANILEFGFASGRHFSYLFSKAAGLKYTGIETSELMHGQAFQFNTSLPVSPNIELHLKSENTTRFEFEDGTFDACFSVNTIYFWDEPNRYLKEIYRLLHNNGVVALSFLRDDFICKQSFYAEEIFHSHRVELLMRLMTNIGYRDVEQWVYNESIQDKNGDLIIRPFIILKGIR